MTCGACVNAGLPSNHEPVYGSCPLFDLSPAYVAELQNVAGYNAGQDVDDGRYDD